MRYICFRNEDILVAVDGRIWNLKDEPLTCCTFDPSPDSSRISPIACSSNGKLVAVLDQKSLWICDFDSPDTPTRLDLPRATSAIRFSPDSKTLLVADKTGDAYAVDVDSTNRVPVKIVGHLSMLLDILMSENGKYVITCDRDEKIKVSNYPDTYNVQAYCLGHREFVTHVELLPHDSSLMLSASGDSCIKIWNFADGEEVLSVDINDNLENEFVEEFIESMKTEDVEVDGLPISCISCCKIDETNSLVGMLNYCSKYILLYKIEGNAKNLKCEYVTKIEFEDQPECFILREHKLWVLYCTNKVYAEEWNLKDSDPSMIAHHVLSKNLSTNTVDFLTLYKRKFDNVQEYQFRKKQRLDNCK